MAYTMNALRFTFLLVLTTVLALPLSGSAALLTTTKVVAASGDPAPDGNGSFSLFLSPALNDAGQAAFVAGLTGTSDGPTGQRGVFLGDGSPGGLLQIVREDQPLPSGGFFTNFAAPSVNDGGGVAFYALALGDDDGSIHRGDGTATGLTAIASTGDAGPGGDGHFDRIGLSSPKLNNSGDVVFKGRLVGTAAVDGDGVFLGNGGSLTTIARVGDAAVGGGTVETLSNPGLNDAGQAAFFANLVGGDSGVYRGAGGALTSIARTGDAVPDGNGTLSSFTVPAINEAGWVSFAASATDPDGDGSATSVALIGDGTSLTLLARAGQAAPDGNGTFQGIADAPAINDLGQAAFAISLEDTFGGSSDNSAIFLGDGGPLTVVAHEGAPVPGGDGEFRLCLAPTLNNAGQVAFRATIRNASDGAGVGIFFSDPVKGLLTVAREGDALLGSAIVALNFENGTAGRGDERSGLNELGQVAYTFTLADGRSGIAVWTVPEPTSLALLALGGSIICVVRRRRAIENLGASI